MEKSRIIIVEGPQGTGKTTLTNYLRDNIPSSNLYRLSGQKDKTNAGKIKSKMMYEALLKYLKEMQHIPMDLIFDRTFFSEEIYARLGYKEYSFTDVFHELYHNLISLNYDIYLFLLYIEDISLYRERLNREFHHNYQAFSIDNSKEQQNQYLQLYTELKDSNIHIVPLAMDNYEIAYEKVNQLLKIR